MGINEVDMDEHCYPNTVNQDFLQICVKQTTGNRLIKGIQGCIHRCGRGF